MSFCSLTDLQKVTTLPLVALDAVGNPAPIDGIPVWTVTDPSLLQIIPADDGLTCQIITIGPLGVAQVIATADADLGEGIVPITGTLSVEVTGSQAVSLSIAAGVPELKEVA